MNFALDDDHLTLRESAGAFLDKEIDLAPLLVPGATVADAGYAKTWAKIADLGWPGLIIPEADGGLGMTAIDLTMIVAEMGRTLAPAPLFGTLAGTWAVMRGGSVEQKTRLLPQIAAGKHALALAVCDANGGFDGPASDAKARVVGEGVVIDGAKAFVIDVGHADTLVVAAEADGARAWYLVEARQPGVEIEVLPWRDITREVCTVRFTAAEAERLPGADADIWPYVRDRLLLVLAAESAAGLREILDFTAAYAQERVAFGRPIGAYQAIKHALADMVGASEGSNAAVLYAAWALSDAPDKASEAAAIAKAYACEAYVEATHRSIQVFGAIGFTWEMKNHLYFKRARANAELFGAARIHRARVIEMLRRAA